MKEFTTSALFFKGNYQTERGPFSDKAEVRLKVGRKEQVLQLLRNKCQLRDFKQ